MTTAAGKIEVRRHPFSSSGFGPVLWLALLAALPCCAQMTSGAGQSGSQTQRSSTMRGAPLPDMDQPMATDLGDSVFQERRLEQLNAAQHKSMVSDTDKLLKLITELNAEISSTNPNELTAQQLRKIAEIEKLAHAVKDKMRMSVRGTTDNMDRSPISPFAGQH